MDNKDLAKFLVEAKRKGYASVGESGEQELIDGGKQIKVYKDNYIYTDTYYGFNPFSGIELVLFDNKPVWSMTYRGKLLGGDSEKVFEFLKKALQKVSSMNPFRGPKSFGEGSFEYMNEYEGDIKDFRGEEKIMVDGVLVHEVSYFGGRIRRKVV